MIAVQTWNRPLKRQEPASYLTKMTLLRMSPWDGYVPPGASTKLPSPPVTRRSLSIRTYANAYFGRAHSLWMSGRSEEAIASHDEAIRRSPRDPIMWAFTASKAIALIIVGRPDEGLEWAVRALQQPNAAILAHLPKISALYILDRKEEARSALKQALSIKPDLSTGWIGEVLPIADQTTRDVFLGSLRNAGLPD